MVTGTQLQIVFLKYAWWYDLRKMKEILVQNWLLLFPGKKCQKLKRYRNIFQFHEKKKIVSVFCKKLGTSVLGGHFAPLSLFSR